MSKFILATTLTGVVGAASLCGATRPAHTLPVLRPGSSELSTTHFGDHVDSVQYYSQAVGATVESLVSSGRQEEHRIDSRRGPALLLVAKSGSGARSFLDSAVVLRDGLRPISESMHAGARTVHFDYDGARVRLRYSTPDSGEKTREHSYDGDVFHFNELDAIVRSLPLREGFEAIVPLYSEGDDALEMDTVRVLAKNASGAWPVRFADKVIIMTTLVDGATRRATGSDIVRRDGSHGRKVIVPGR